MKPFEKAIQPAQSGAARSTEEPATVTPERLAQIVQEKPWSRITFRITVQSKPEK
jgi:hypothetical protein